MLHTGNGDKIQAPSTAKVVIETTKSTNCPLPFDKIGGTYAVS